MSHLHAFGNLLKQLRSRVPGLTQARVAQLAGYDPAVITRMAKGQQDLIGPQTRIRVLRVIGALDEAGALRSVAEANALLAAANLSPLIEASDSEAGLLQRLYRHSDSRSTTRYGAVSGTAPAYVRQLLQEYVRTWDKTTHEGERMIVLAAAGEVAMRYGQPALGMRLLARAALAEACVQETELTLQQAFAQQIGDARAKLGDAVYANAWVAGQMLTLSEARAWLVVLPSLLGNGKGNHDR
ncbi:MAG: XRE family transcriptional regulator [Caldilinea sp. CFX5]|nr:XRE family transcriptional regulator [Caldilinea sp. CFX5]